MDKVFISLVDQEWIDEITSYLKSIGINDICLNFTDIYPKLDDIFWYARRSFICELAELLKMRNVKGDVAELGVYKGELAKYLNAYFVDSELYLLDTFEGFDNRDTTFENTNNLSSASVGDFSDTSLEAVKAKMPCLDKCHFIKGYFPQSASQIPNDARFKFVNLDTDLYQPILAGLEFFYPRLNSGGVILIHDYTNPTYPGVKKAVHEFAGKYSLRFYPCGDGYSVFFTKE